MDVVDAGEARETEQRMRLARIAYDKSISAALPHTCQKGMRSESFSDAHFQPPGLITLRFNPFGELLSVKRGACSKVTVWFQFR